MTRTIIFGWFMLVIRMYLWKPSGCSMLTSVVWTSLRRFRYEVGVVRMSYVYKCRLNFLEAVQIWEARHVYPDGGNPDGNACHVSPWGAWYVFSGGGVPTMPPFLTWRFCLNKMGGLKNNFFFKLRLLFALIGPRGERGWREREAFMMSRRPWVFPGSMSFQW